jgi:histone H3/H4
MARTVAQKQKARSDGGPAFQAFMRNEAIKASVANAKLSAPAGGSGTSVVKKKPRYRPGVKAIQEIRMYQKCNKPILRKIPFTRLVRERAGLVVTKRFGTGTSLAKGVMFRPVGLEVAAEMWELWMVRLLEDALLCCLHRKVKGVQTKDLVLAMRMRAKPTAQWQYEQVEWKRTK